MRQAREKARKLLENSRELVAVTKELTRNVQEEANRIRRSLAERRQANHYIQ
jgi:hypothetical protein